MPPQQPPNQQPLPLQMMPQQPPNQQPIPQPIPPRLPPPQQLPYQHSMVQPQLYRPPTFQQSMHPSMAQPKLQRPPTFQQPVARPPSIQHSLLPQYPSGAYPPQPQPIQHSTMPPVNIAIAPPVTTGIPILFTFKNGDDLQAGIWIPVREPTVMVGLGWDFTGQETFDLDASVTGFNSDYEIVESIYFSHKKGLSNSVIHFGDNLTGKGEGDDEVIKVILAKVPKRV